MKPGKPLQRRKPIHSGWKGMVRPSRKAKQDGHHAPLQRRQRIPRRAMKVKPRQRATPEEQAWMDRVARLDCICCVKDGTPPMPTNLHHIRAGYKSGQRASHWEVLPLCEGHHQGLRAGNKGILAFHRARKTWEMRYGSETENLEAVYAELGVPFDHIILRIGHEPPWWAAHHRRKSGTLTETARRILAFPQEPPCGNSTSLPSSSASHSSEPLQSSSALE